MDQSSLMNVSEAGGESPKAADEASGGAREERTAITVQTLSDELRKINLNPELGTKFPSDPLEKKSENFEE